MASSLINTLVESTPGGGPGQALIGIGDRGFRICPPPRMGESARLRRWAPAPLPDSPPRADADALDHARDCLGGTHIPLRTRLPFTLGMRMGNGRAHTLWVRGSLANVHFHGPRQSYPRPSRTRIVWGCGVGPPTCRPVSVSIVSNCSQRTHFLHAPPCDAMLHGHVREQH